MKTRKKLKNSMVIACVVFAVCLSLAIGALGFTVYRRGMLTKYHEYITDVLTYAVNGVDVEKIDQAIKEETWNDTCEDMKERLDEIKETHKIKFIYMVRPLNNNATDNMTNIMAGETLEEKENDEPIPFLSLTGDAYPVDVVKYYMDRMDGSEHITFYSNDTEWGSMYTGLKPLVNAVGETVAITCVDIEMDEIIRTLYMFVAMVFAGAVILTGLFLYFLIYWMNYRIVEPISRIETATISFVQSSHEEDDPKNISYTKPVVQTGDEMEKLSDSITSMAEDLKKYMVDLVAETSEKEKVRTELNLATTIQASFLPSIFPAFPERSEFDIYASMDPAKEVGGDFYDFFLIDEDHLGLVIADVSGKGVPAALFMMISKILLKNQAYSGVSPKVILREVNNQLCANNKAQMFVTAWLGILELSTGKVIAGNAGHEYPAIRRAGGQFELIKDRHSLILGAMEDVPYKEYELQLEPGDTLFLYTDGVPEATNAEEELFGTDRMLKGLNKEPDAKPEALLSNVRAEIDTFVADAPQFDDLTMLSIKYKGTKER